MSNSAATSSAPRSLRPASASAPTGASSSNSQTVWRDGTSHFFEPIEFLEKLAALIPRPAVNLLLYHGVLASRAGWRSQVVRYGRPAPDAAALTREAHPAVPTHAWTWAALMHRTLDLAVLAWLRCGGRLRSSPPSRIRHLVRAFLAHLNLAPGPDIPGPAPSPTTPPPPRPAAGRSQALPDHRQHPAARAAVCPTPAALDHRRVPSAPSPQGVGAQRRRGRRRGAGRAADGRVAGECHGALGEAPGKAAFRYDNHS